MHGSEKFWNRMSKKYDKRAGKYGQVYTKTVEKTKSHLGPDDIVLDFACGTGIITTEIAENAKQVHAIDTSSGMIHEAETKAAERGIENIHFVQSDLFDERYDKASFDVILAFNILHLLDDTRKAVQRINELLKPGGLFISSTACLGGKKTVMKSFLLFLSRTRIIPSIRSFKPSELETLIAGADFRIVETEDLHRAPPNYFVVAKKMP